MVSADSDEESELEEPMAQLNLEPMLATFAKPKDEKWKHLKALFWKGCVDGKLKTNMLVDGGAVVKTMPYTILRELETPMKI